MNCRAARKRFSERLDGRLEPAERRALDAHLSACASCAAAWARYGERIEAFARAVAAQRTASAPAAALRAAAAAPRARPAWRGLAAAWGISALAVAWFAREMGSLAVEAPLGLETFPQHALAWGVLYVALAMGLHALFYPGEVTEATIRLWRLRGSPASAAVGSPAGLRGLGISLLFFSIWGAHLYGNTLCYQMG